jgi:hypothetical protein
LEKEKKHGRLDGGRERKKIKEKCRIVMNFKPKPITMFIIFCDFKRETQNLGVGPSPLVGF